MKEFPFSCTAFVENSSIKFSDDQKKIMSAFLKKKDQQYVRVQISQPSKPRSLNQNSYYWAVVLTMIAAESKDTTEEVHEYMKAAFLPKTFRTYGGVEREIQKSTTTLSTMEMEEYLEQIRVFANQFMNLIIPLPNESL